MTESAPKRRERAADLEGGKPPEIGADARRSEPKEQEPKKPRERAKPRSKPKAETQDAAQEPKKKTTRRRSAAK
ncbi:MAG: hypothetical protein QOG16_155, partial [Actinomycetota bacterium]|nr:hypothetical protein [Actinomycetota bacterium]